MEPTEEVLVVIQAESGEEIAVPLAALDEQHREVILDSDGSAGGKIGLQSNGQNVPDDRVSTNGTTSNDISDMEVDPMIKTTPVKEPVVPRPKQRRKEKLVCLPLFEDDNNLEFQSVDQSVSPTREESKRKPRKEYRTKRRLAALSASNEEQQRSHPDTPKEAKRDKIEETSPPPQPRPLPQPPPPSSPKQADASPQQASQRRTRLSNSCRVATEKMYKCTECDFSTERINNIILHMKETCPKIKKET